MLGFDRSIKKINSVMLITKVVGKK